MTQEGIDRKRHRFMYGDGLAQLLSGHLGSGGLTDQSSDQLHLRPDFPGSRKINEALNKIFEGEFFGWVAFCSLSDRKGLDSRAVHAHRMGMGYLRRGTGLFIEVRGIGKKKPDRGDPHGRPIA